jgi:hypothetical protein
MKKYLLLRHNRETGPHTIEQLASISLFPLDLIWIEDESTTWKYPEEIEELKDLINYDVACQKLNQFDNKKDKIFTSLPSNFSQKNHRELNDNYLWLPVANSEPVLETNYKMPLEELKENYKTSKQKRPIWNKKILASSNAASVAAVFIGVVLGAFVIKKMVDGYVPDITEETAMATPIIDREVEKQPTENFKNALVTEIVPVYKTIPAKTAKPGDIKKQIRIKTNNYKVGLFGGINGLQLTVFNTSPQVVDKVIVALDYLRPNGAVVQSENVSFTSIKPRGAQTIAIPGSDRGVKLRYKILKVYARDYKADLKQA